FCILGIYERRTSSLRSKLLFFAAPCCAFGQNAGEKLGSKVLLSSPYEKLLDVYIGRFLYFGYL
ncbi:MAG: hypothetical protein IJ424_08550, partial [Oscillospiraceae bacterium]|nr:hypothetical protein [Oscillospiraceae bacterium]